jgi:hypothetical protein
MTIEWIRELCPEIAEWQAELIAQKIEGLREANEAFAKRQEWWTERMFELEKQLGDAVLAEREACAMELERSKTHLDDVRLELAASTYFIASRVTEFLAARIRARGDA